MAARPRDDHLGKAARVDGDEMVRPDCVDDALGCDCTACPEVRGAEHRHVGGGAGVLDQVADAHDVAGDGDVRPQRGFRRLRGGCGRPRAAKRQRQREHADDRANHGNSLSQRINCAVICSIWSAAVITFEFIS
jgi:hypothetical protein